MRRILGLSTLLALSACGTALPRFEARFSPSYTRPGRVSVIGLVKDGRMSAEEWGELGPTLLSKRCEAAYGPSLLGQNRPAASAVDDYVQANGVTPALVGELADYAEGEGILLVSVAGHPPRQTGPAYYTPKPIFAQQVKPATSFDCHTPTDGGVFEVSVSLFSVVDRHPVAELRMTYTGNDVDGALRDFAARLAKEGIAPACGGWKPELARLEEAKIRSLPTD